MMMLRGIFSFTLLFGIVKADGFSYNDPSTWGEQYPACNGNNQSPIDIPWQYDPSRLVQPRKLRWNNYGITPNSMRIVNNGHTIQISPTWTNNADRPYLSGGPLRGKYVIEQFHFHWGQNDSVGSEHTFGGRRTAMELHMVHWKRKYGSFDVAALHPDGLAVIGVFYEPIVAKSSGGIEHIWRELGKLRQENTAAQIVPFPLSEFEVVNSGAIFVSYFGSLTTPGCNEVVTWLVSLRPSSVTSDELQQIRLVGLGHGDVDNYRPVQKMNYRKFTYYRSV